MENKGQSILHKFLFKLEVFSKNNKKKVGNKIYNRYSGMQEGNDVHIKINFVF